MGPTERAVEMSWRGRGVEEEEGEVGSFVRSHPEGRGPCWCLKEGLAGGTFQGDENPDAC